ncbi:HAMP domain-containing histidine kinase [Geovibrio thiophilus]|uniref:HAMP domain-containing histidine kinase n=1 Tax=Geovibrio thiophilus TaxID=139438 RepID=A0A410JVE7_9BACT|nr:HAMP domain-containing histidine kinase [Geovibrio thiophilus]QAR32187.1 HAMP domain-containing histidine kinase [Geovibrio thiophilus]
MNAIYISAVLFISTAAAAYILPQLPGRNAPFMLTLLVCATACATAFAFWRAKKNREREEELSGMILKEEKRTVGRFLIHEWRGLIQSIGIQAEMMERADNVEGVRINCGVIRKILREEAEKTDRAEFYFRKDGQNIRKSSKAVQKAVADAEIFHGKKRVKVVYNTGKKDMKSDFDKLHPCVFFALMNAFAAIKDKSGAVTLTVADRVLGFTEFLEISVEGGDMLFDKEIEDLFHPFNVSPEKFRGYFGLATVRRIASDMGGFAEAERGIDKTCVYIVIPVAK